MPNVRIVVQYQIEQVTILDISEDELKNMTYDDALANAQFDEFQPSLVEIAEIVDVKVDGKEHYF